MEHWTQLCLRGEGLEIEFARAGNRSCGVEGAFAEWRWGGKPAADVVGAVVGSEEAVRYGMTTFRRRSGNRPPFAF